MPPQSPGKTPIFRIEIANKNRLTEQRIVQTPIKNELVASAHQIGIHQLTGCQVMSLFFVQGDLQPDEINRLAETLLADPVTETFTIAAVDDPAAEDNSDHIIEVTLLPGVTDPAADNLVRAGHLLGLSGLQRAATAQRYLIHGDLSQEQLAQFATRILANPVIQRYQIDQPITPPFVPYQEADDTVDLIDLRESDDDDLLRISAERRLALDLAEMQAIRAYFQSEDRATTDAELEMLAQTWSEHCGHKTFKAEIAYNGPLPGASPDSEPVEQTIDGLLKTYIRAATDKVAKPWVYSAFVDNAGIVAFTDQYDLAFKLETHNHPSALEPFGGANTGVGGVVRDVLGVSARPIANTDILCFGPPDLPESDLPKAVLHPRRIADGVIRGVEDYGNKMGIPTVNGAILYHPGYTANPLVFCGCLGILPHDSHPTAASPGDMIIVIGGRTGRDGLRGATFSSMEMDTTTSEVSGSAVQIGNPIQEKQVQEVILRARDEKLYTAITDCGAGGLSSAVGEMAQNLGAHVRLETVPLKYPGLRPWEIWLSEAQERMVLAIPPGNWPRLQEICAGQDVEAICIGTFEDSGRLKLHYNERLVADITMDFLHDGIPRRHLRAEWPSKNGGHGKGDSRIAPTKDHLEASLLKLLAHPNIRSKESVVRVYDHEVGAGTAVKPLVGVDNHGPGDATVLIPHETQNNGSRKGVALGNGICPEYTDLDPYAMAWAAIDESIRNIVAVGADPDQIAILDNFCWGNANLPDRMGSLVRCAQGCYDAALAYGVPFISGKDSLNNEYMGADSQRHAIPGTLLISAMGIVPDVTQTVTMDLKAPGNLLYIIGETRDEMGGSHYNLVHGISGGVVPQSNPDAPKIMSALHKAIQAGLIQSCHDVSEGGIAVAVAEMCIAGRLGAVLQTTDMAQFDKILPGDDDRLNLFAESISRFVVEVRNEDSEQFEAIMESVPFGYFGDVAHTDAFCVSGVHNALLVDLTISDLEKAWRGDLPAKADSDSPSLYTGRELARGVGQAGREVKVLILHANGTNRDRDAIISCELAGGQPEVVHVNQLLSGERSLLDYDMLVVPGGFSYGDDLGAGVLWALDVGYRLGDDVRTFIAQGRPVLGICNGFQTLVKAGLLPGADWSNGDQRKVTLTYNERAHFECRWVYLKANSASPNLFTDGLDDLIYCPVAHGEGRIAVQDDATLDRLWSNGLAALTYVDANGNPADYPANPNGSAAGIAGLCNAAGNVFGLMPHPEDHVFDWQHPHRHRGVTGMTGLRLFQNGIKHA